MSAEIVSAPDVATARSLWSRVKMPAFLLLILANVLFFGGNAAIDLWQTFGPAQHFTGTITGHEQVTSQGESSDVYNLLTIDSNRGTLRLNVFDKTYNDTHVGQHVIGELDSHGIFGHDEGLRSLTADGREVFNTQSVARAAGQALTLFVVLVAAGLAVKLAYRRPKRPAEAGAVLPATS